MSKITVCDWEDANPRRIKIKPEHIIEITGKQAAREVVKGAARFIMHETASEGVKLLAKEVVKGAASPAFIVGDLVEIGFKHLDAPTVGKTASLTIYTVAGGCIGGPVGILIGGTMWGIGQLIGSLF